MTDFEPAEQLWIDRFGNLRNVIRQEVIARQLAASLSEPGTVLDVGCGQGEQLLRLVANGWQATGFDKSTELLDLFRTSAADRGYRPETVAGTFDQLPEVLVDRSFDLVCAHGLLMYLPDCASAIATLARHLAPGGHLSITFRNGGALAWRHGLQQDWAAALDAFDSESKSGSRPKSESEAANYVNGLGLPATAHRLADVERHVEELGLHVSAWFGVRVFHEGASFDQPVPDPATLASILDVEERAGQHDPYRRLGGQLHLIAQRLE